MNYPDDFYEIRDPLDLFDGGQFCLDCLGYGDLVGFILAFLFLLASISIFLRE